MSANRQAGAGRWVGARDLAAGGDTAVVEPCGLSSPCMESRKDWSSSTMEIKDGSSTTVSGASLAASTACPTARPSTALLPRVLPQRGWISKPWFRCERAGTRRNVDSRSWRLRALSFLRQKIEFVRHSAELWERCGLDLAHHVAPMNLHRGFGDAHVAGNLLVQSALYDLDENRAFTRRQFFESGPERAQGFFVLAARAVSSEPYIHGIQKILIPERLCQKLDGARLHRLHGHRNITVPGDEDDRERGARRGKIALKLQPAHSRHSHI